MKHDRFAPAPVLAGLKDFQRRTVDRVFERLYLDDPPGRRFLVADEVGLGKTMVARGIVARALEHLHDRVARIDVVYVCSNAAIAAQNVNRLNVLEDTDFAVATRLTLLPIQVHDLSKRSINFVSFTPGTTFDLKSRGGRMDERIVIYKLLEGAGLAHPRGLRNLLQNNVQHRRWNNSLDNWNERIDTAIRKKFVSRIRVDKDLRRDLEDLAEYFSDRRRRITREHRQDRLALIGRLRHTLASVCIDALEPDLVILDEFQRFRDLLDGKDDAAMLARALFEYPDVRVLLLSATPYKMLSLDHEEEEDHYPDFLRTLGFLLNDVDGGEVVKVKEDIGSYRRALYAAGEDGADEAIGATRQALERGLRAVMCRTERVAMTRDRDAMLAELSRPAPVASADLRQARLADALSRAVRAPDPIEYWKSSPYTLNFLRHYKLRERLMEVMDRPPRDVLAAFRDGAGSLLDRPRLDAYAALDPSNARMRCLFADTLDQNLWRLLWMPPSMPYSAPAGVFGDVGEATKALVFSSWTLVPDAIASVCSYEAERRMLAASGRRFGREKLYDELRPLLRFTREADGRLAGMPALVRLYPSPSLATIIDPFTLALEYGEGAPLSRERLVELAEKRLRSRVKRLVFDVLDQRPAGREDERWYWALPALLDATDWPAAAAWCRTGEGWTAAAADDESGAGFREHVVQLVRAMDDRLDPPLGTPPADLPRVAAEFALAGPAVCLLRALRRIAPELAVDAPEMLSAAAHGASGFRTLFNIPESIGLLRGADPDTPYWRLALHYGIDGNLQALLDEQIHVLQESLGLITAASGRRVKETADALADALSIRTAQVRVDEYRMSDDDKRITHSDFNLRSRFALRFGELKDDREQTLARADTVRTAFNSPFRPFVLASTSIGQEGLDFHTWCHAVMHWNLPSNPVDLEQREGRVHRFKGHAVRKNLTRAYGLMAIRRRSTTTPDPWRAMFDMATEDREPGTSDLVPYWIFEIEDGTRVERRVPLIPYSREVGQLARLKRGLALYRLVFGQPRQEDLLEHLSHNLPDENIERIVAAWKIDLSP